MGNRDTVQCSSGFHSFEVLQTRTNWKSLTENGASDERRYHAYSVYLSMIFIFGCLQYLSITYNAAPELLPPARVLTLTSSLLSVRRFIYGVSSLL